MRPGLRAGNILDASAVTGAIRLALDGVSAKGGERSKYVTLVVPDGAVRVLLLDFDVLPGKAAEALAVVRFRLKKLLPFDPEHAVVSYQVMSSGRDSVRVLAVAMPCEVLAEYEALVAAAGYLPGAVLPSTLAALGALDGGEADSEPTLVVNAGPGSVTTAIVQGAVLLLHRTVDLASDTGSGLDGPRGAVIGLAIPGDDPAATDTRTELRSSVVRMQQDGSNDQDYDRLDNTTGAQGQVLGRLERARVVEDEAGDSVQLPTEPDEAVRVLNESTPLSVGREITQAVSVAAAYFEDTLGGAPPSVMAAGTMGAERLRVVLGMYGMDELRVREMVTAEALAGASTSKVPWGWLAGVWGALKG